MPTSKTGIANIGLGGTSAYTIGYNTAITNGAGADLDIVVARYSADTVRMNVSSDGSAYYFGFQSNGPVGAVDSGVGKTYYYGGGGPFAAELWVMSVDLSDFGVALGATVNAHPRRPTTWSSPARGGTWPPKTRPRAVPTASASSGQSPPTGW